ncbi:MAG: hypothetical protein ABSC91_02085 [Candidatus Bathyarchaeia archaeon]
MRKNVIFVVITATLLISMIMASFRFDGVPSVSATTQNRIILPFHTSFEDPAYNAKGLTNTVDWSSNFYGYYGPNNPLQPECGVRSNGDSGVNLPPDGTYKGYNFGTKYLMAAGWFNSTYSYCYYILFDAANSDWKTPIKMMPNTFLSLWYYHYNLTDCMIDAELFNIRTRQHSELRNFRGCGGYIVDQNGVRIHPACRSVDPIGSWQFACFDLSVIYASDPGNWYITKIWIGFDNDPSIGDGKTGPCRTYFDMIYLSYSMSYHEEHTIDQYNSYGMICSIEPYDWFGPDEHGKYHLWVKISDSAYSTNTLLSPYQGDATVNTKANQSAVFLPDPPPVGINMTNTDTVLGKFKEWIADVGLALLDQYDSGLITIAQLTNQFVQIWTTPPSGVQYTWPTATIYSGGNSVIQTYGEVCVELILGDVNPPVESNISITVHHGFDIWAIQERMWWHWYDISHKFSFSWGYNPDQIATVLTISTSGGDSSCTTSPAAGTHSYDYGTSVTVTAYPDSANGCFFGFWYLDGVYAGGSTSVPVTMTSDHSLTAYFFQGGGGGCPYVATWNGTGYVLDNCILPDSEMSSGRDVKDYYKLEQPLVPTLQDSKRSIYSLEICEFEHEHDYIDRAQLLAVDHLGDVNVAVTPTGEILTYKKPASPISAKSNDGTNVLPLLNAADGKYYQGYNGSYVTLTFAATDVSAGAKLVVRADDYSIKCPIYVQVINATGQWNTVASFDTRSNWATDIINMTGLLPDAEGNLRVRLLFVSTDEIDYVGLDTTPQANIQVHEATLLSAFSSSQGDVTRLLKADDEKYAELVPGQQILLTFMLPTERNSQRTLILYAEGHYYTLP